MPSTLDSLACSICDAPHDVAIPQTFCRTCGRAFLARYELSRAKEAFERRAYLDRDASMWRYEEVMPVGAAPPVSLGEGGSLAVSSPAPQAPACCRSPHHEVRSCFPPISRQSVQRC